MDNEYLVHYGVLGMHWGIRRYQNADGSYKKGAEGRYDPDYDPKEHKASSGKNTKSSSTETKTTSKKNITIDDDIEKERKALKAALIAGGVVLAAGGACYCYAKINGDKYGSDFELKPGDLIYRTASGDTDALHDVFYATPDKTDSYSYIENWGVNAETGMMKYAKQFAANKTLKIAGNETGKQVFLDLKWSSPEFNAALKTVRQNSYYNVDSWEEFNHICPLLKSYPEPFALYKNALEKLGYNGVIDYNDKYGLGLGTKAPVIFFGGNENFSTKTVKQLTNTDIGKAAVQYAFRTGVESLVSTEAGIVMMEYGAATVASMGLSLAAESTQKSTSKEKVSK